MGVFSQRGTRKQGRAGISVNIGSIENLHGTERFRNLISSNFGPVQFCCKSNDKRDIVHGIFFGEPGEPGEDTNPI